MIIFGLLHLILALSFVVLNIIDFRKTKNFDGKYEDLQKFRIKQYKIYIIICLSIFVTGMIDDIYFGHMWGINFIWFFNIGINYYFYKKIQKEYDKSIYYRKRFLNWGDLNDLQKVDVSYWNMDVQKLVVDQQKMDELQELKKKKDNRLDNINKVLK